MKNHKKYTKIIHVGSSAVLAFQSCDLGSNPNQPGISLDPTYSVRFAYIQYAWCPPPTPESEHFYTVYATWNSLASQATSIVPKTFSRYP